MANEQEKKNFADPKKPDAGGKIPGAKSTESKTGSNQTTPDLEEKLKKEVEKVKTAQEGPVPGKSEIDIEAYTIQIDNIPLSVRIVDVGDYVMHYNIALPEIDFVTKALLDETKRNLVNEIQIETRSVLDPDKFREIKNKFLERSNEKLKNILKHAPLEDIAVLSRILVNEMIGLGELEYLLSDGHLEEVVVNSSKDVVWVYHKRHGWLKTNMILHTEEIIMNYSARIAREIGREITHLEPLLDAHLVTGDRVNATLFPISTIGNTITIRRFSRTPWTIIHLIDPKQKTINSEAAAFLWLAIEYELSILVTGGTASGKTSMLNALTPFLPANQRIISIEDTRELNLPSYLHWIPLTTRPPTPRGEGEVSMLDLVENSLRMRPDRIIVGEVRRKRETEVLFEAMHTGHSVYGTFHAQEAREVVDRITSPPMSIPGIVMGSLQLILVQYLNRRTGQRRTFEIVELVKGDSELPEINPIFRWQPRGDTIEKVGPSVRVRDDLEMFTGMTEKEMWGDIEGKKKVLDWLLRRDIRDVNDVGKIVNEYYMDKDTVLDLIKHDKDIEV